MRLTGELATGTVITQGTSPDNLRTAVAQVRAGEAVSPRPHAHSVVTYVLCTTGPGAQKAMEAEYARWKCDPGGDFGVHGDAAAIASGVGRWVDAGADTIVLQPPVDADVEQFVSFVGREVRPILRLPVA